MHWFAQTAAAAASDSFQTSGGDLRGQAGKDVVLQDIYNLLLQAALLMHCPAQPLSKQQHQAGSCKHASSHPCSERW